MRVMEDEIATELAWAAGFFDGEGSIYLGITPAYAGFRVSISQADRRPLDRGGRVLGPYANGRLPHRKPIHTINYSGKAAMSVIHRLWPYLSEPKKEQTTRKVLEFYARKDLALGLFD